jgi:23S rRNA (adenine-N6)-dimethyltransferase
VSADRRTCRDKRRRRLGQNFLRPEFADRLVAEADIQPGELVMEVGAGPGAITIALAHREIDVVAVEVDPVWAQRLRDRVRGEGRGRVRVVEADFLSLSLPTRPFRVMGSLPFSRTTEILRRLLDNPRVPLKRAGLIVQWDVARKRAAVPPSTLLSTVWTPWWEFRIGRSIPAAEFRPIPQVDGGVLVVTRRDHSLLPPTMAALWAGFVRAHWPFDRTRVR